MANTTTTTKQFQFEYQFQRGNETASRSLTFDTEKTIDAGAAVRLKEIAASLSASPYNWAIQPSGWRDGDISEDAWQTIAVTPKIIQKTVTTIDMSS